MSTYKQILEGQLDFPKSMSRAAQDIIRRLLHPSYSKRLGCLRNGTVDVRLHRFFGQVDLKELLKCKLQVPHVPKIQDSMDTSNFMKYDDDPDPEYKDDGSGCRGTTVGAEAFECAERGRGAKVGGLGAKDAL